MNLDFATLAIALLALGVSIVTAYLTLLHRGSLLMTRPTQFYIGPDGPHGLPKVFVTALMYSTSRRGHVVENMFLRLRRGESSQNFNVWVYRGKRENENLVRGSGYFVTRDGAPLDHHFLLPKDGTNFDILPGDYSVEVFATLANKSEPILLTHQHVKLDSQLATKAKERAVGIYYDWGADLGKYQPHLDDRSQKALEDFFARKVV